MLSRSFFEGSVAQRRCLKSDVSLELLQPPEQILGDSIVGDARMATTQWVAAANWRARWIACAILAIGFLSSTGCAKAIAQIKGSDAATQTAASEQDGKPADDAAPAKGALFNIPAKTSGGNQIWSDVLVYSGWRIQHNLVFDHYRLLDARDVRRAWGTLEACQSKFEQLKHDEIIAAPRGKVVVVVHGLWRNRDAMEPMCKFLRENSDYHVVGITYASTRLPIGDHAANLARIVDGLGTEVTELNFVGCSLGNLVIRRYLGDCMAGGKTLDKRVNRIVMIAPPNQGVQIATRFASDPVLKTAWGVPGSEIAEWKKLSATLATPPGEFGILAGGTGPESTRNPLISGDDDFLIAVEETKLAGAADFQLLPASHASIKRDPTALKYTLNFLQHGYFIAADKKQPLAK